MTKAEAKLRIAKLIEEINYHRHLYYVLDKQEISDTAFDYLEKELLDLEKKFPDLVKPDSPTQRVGGKALKKFKKVMHRQQILSLADAFNLDDLQAWQERNERILKNKTKGYYSELKMDGLTVILSYLDGVLVTGATRGDGQSGEDVTMNLKTIKSIPLRLKPLTTSTLPKIIEVRAEVVMTKKVFQALNKEQAQKNLPLFANPRNVAAGSIRQLDPKITSSRKLDCLAFELLTDLGQKTHQEVHQLLAQLGFKTSPYNETCHDLKQVNKYLQKWENKRKNLAYETDGVVVVVNDIEQEKILGQVGKADRWMIAYKFPAETSTTKVLDIEIQVGRTGALTPVAILQPVKVAGSIVSRATLHNQDEIKRLDVRIGDTVIIQKAGDIIPDIIQVLPKLRTAKEKPFVFPKNCPVCHNTVQQKPGEVAWYCKNKKCYAQNIESLIHFVSKKAFNIEGLGDKIIKQLVDNGLISTAADIFSLKLGDLEVLERFATKKAQNLITAIEKSKNISSDRFLYALGIRHVGTETAIILADYFKSLEKFQATTTEELENLHEIGPEVASSIISWLKDKNNLLLLQNLQKAQIHLEYKQVINNQLNGQSFLFTGTLKLERTEAQNMVRAKGGKIVSSVSKNLDYLVVGDRPGSKLKQAEKLKLNILNETEFLQLVKYIMENLILTNIYIFILALVLAILEIQIEVPNGWAKNLPTWRPKVDKWYVKLYMKFMSGREATGYHITMFSFVFLIFNLPYVFGLSLNLEHYLKTLSFFLIFIVLWDFLWFVLNPYYPLKKFKAEHIWWHKKWLLGAPVDYYGGVVLSLLILLPIIYLNNSSTIFFWWLQNVLLFTLETIILIIFSFWVLDIDNWHKK